MIGNKIFDNIKKYNNIAILGFGKEGKSTYDFIRKTDKDLFLTILDAKEIELNDKNAVYKLYEGEESLKDYDLIIKTPGVSVYNFSDETKKRFTSQLELLLEVDRKNIVGVTATKGKSTTTSLIYKILKDQLDDVFLVGNIGTPMFDYMDEYTENSIIVGELSALQLETVKYSPHIGIVINLFVDHLDHQGTIENYHHSKMNIMRFQDEDDYGIYDIDNEYLKQQDFSNIKSHLLGLSNKEKTNIYLDPKGDIYINDEFLINRKDIKTKLLGEHNLKNMMFAIMVSKLYNLDFNKTLKTIAGFEPLEHRIELVGTYKDIIFYNDAISTIPESTINACETLKIVDTLIFGGLDRNIDYSKMIDYLNNSKIGHFICMPTTGYKMAEFLDSKRVIKVQTLEEAVSIAFKVTEKNKICLLSPAAASYEFFKNFEEKGKRYKELVR